MPPKRGRPAKQPPPPPATPLTPETKTKTKQLITTPTNPSSKRPKTTATSEPTKQKHSAAIKKEPPTTSPAKTKTKNPTASLTKGPSKRLKTKATPAIDIATATATSELSEESSAKKVKREEGDGDMEYGKCHCGQATWEVKLMEKKHILCHCNTCKKVSGGAYTLNQIVNAEDFKLTQGTLNTYTYIGDSGNPVFCFYCPNCTSHAYHQAMHSPDKYVIRTILLDSGKDMEVASEIYGKDRLPWQVEVA